MLAFEPENDNNCKFGFCCQRLDYAGVSKKGEGGQGGGGAGRLKLGGTNEVRARRKSFPSMLKSCTGNNQISSTPSALVGSDFQPFITNLLINHRPFPQKIKKKRLMDHGRPFDYPHGCLT